MWVFQFLLIAFIYVLPILAGQTEEKNMAKYYCRKIGYSHTPGMYKSGDVKQANNDYKKCKKRFLALLDLVKLPSENEVDQFIDVCTKFVTTAEKCTNVIENLKYKGYNFDTAANLFKDISVKRPDIDLHKSWSYICLNCRLRLELLRIDNLNIDQCILYFWVKQSVRERALNTYALWRDKIGNKNTTYCNCDQVLGLHSIYVGRKKNDIKILYEYFQNICMEDFPEKVYWNMDNLKCIAESKELLNGVIIKQFLSKGAPIAEAGWCKYLENYVPFDYLWPKIKSASAEEIKVISYAVSANFNGDHNSKLVKILVGYGNNFTEKKCLDGIIEAAFKRDLNSVNENQFLRKNYVWDFKTFKDENRNTIAPFYDDVDHPFNNHIQILLELFLKTKTTGTCENFASYLSEFKSILVQRNFSSQSLTVDLSELIKKRIDFTEVIQCYRFTLDLEDKIYNTYNMLEKRSEGDSANDFDFFGYEFEFSELRRLLFKNLPPELNQICKNQHPHLNVNSLDSIWDLINTVFKNIDNRNRDLNKLFIKLSEKLEAEIVVKQVLL